MAISRKVERELIRTDFLNKVADYLHSIDEEVLLVKSNEIAIPVVGGGIFRDEVQGKNGKGESQCRKEEEENGKGQGD